MGSYTAPTTFDFKFRLDSICETDAHIDFADGALEAYCDASTLANCRVPINKSETVKYDVTILIPQEIKIVEPDLTLNPTP